MSTTPNSAAEASEPPTIADYMQLLQLNHEQMRERMLVIDFLLNSSNFYMYEIAHRLVIRAWLLKESNCITLAIECAKRALKSWPKLDIAWRVLGYIYYDEECYIEAVHCYRQALTHCVARAPTRLLFLCEYANALFYTAECTSFKHVCFEVFCVYRTTTFAAAPLQRATLDDDFALITQTLDLKEHAPTTRNSNGCNSERNGGNGGNGGSEDNGNIGNAGNAGVRAKNCAHLALNIVQSYAFNDKLELMFDYYVALGACMRDMTAACATLGAIAMRRKRYNTALRAFSAALNQPQCNDYALLGQYLSAVAALHSEHDNDDNEDVDEDDDYEDEAAVEQSCIDMVNATLNGAEQRLIVRSASLSFLRNRAKFRSELGVLLRLALSARQHDFKRRLRQYYAQDMKSQLAWKRAEVVHSLLNQFRQHLRQFKSLSNAAAKPSEQIVLTNADAVLATCHYYLADYYDYHGQYAAASRYIDYALAHEIHAEFLCLQARIYLHAQGPLRALQSLEAQHGQLEHELDAQLHKIAIKCLLRANQIERAETLYALYFGAAAAQRAWHTTELTLAQQRLGRYAEALASCARVEQQCQEYEAPEVLTMALFDVPAYAQLLSELRMKRSSKHYQCLARCAIEIALEMGTTACDGQPSAAQPSPPIDKDVYLAQLQQHFPAELATHLLAFEVYYQAGDDMGMLAALNKAELIDKRNPRIIYAKFRRLVLAARSAAGCNARQAMLDEIQRAYEAAIGAKREPDCLTLAVLSLCKYLSLPAHERKLPMAVSARMRITMLEAWKLSYDDAHWYYKTLKAHFAQTELLADFLAKCKLAFKLADFINW